MWPFTSSLSSFTEKRGRGREGKGRASLRLLIGVLLLQPCLAFTIAGNYGTSAAFMKTCLSSRSPSSFILFAASSGDVITMKEEEEKKEETNNNNNNNDNNKITRPKRGKVNEIDFCMAPSDVSLSRAYNTLATSDGDNNDDSQQQQILSLTRALNSASNRALRRILLSKAWPSPEALNRSLRQVLAAETKKEEASPSSTDQPKCPIPRPVLNILMRKSMSKSGGNSNGDGRSDGDIIQTVAITPEKKQGRTDEEWVFDQIAAFRETYGSLSGYSLAEAYLECILSLATSGEESPKVAEV